MHLLFAWTFGECYGFVMGPERALLSIEAWIRRQETVPEKSKFEKVDSFAFKKFETFIILCVALAIGASEAAAMSAGQVTETRQILEETRQNRQDKRRQRSRRKPGAAWRTLRLRDDEAR